MSSRADALINKLSEIHPKGFDLSLDRISRLLDKLGNPQDKLPPVIHVAGTNGKGSTLAFCRAMLEAEGYSVHVHTSPHLVNWHERYRIAGELVSDEMLSDAIERVAAANNNEPITVFELLSAVMFVLFSENKADYALVEVGLGGRFDATNVITKPTVCAITPIALDHQAFLGDTLEKIAFEKGGIIKEGVPVAIAAQGDTAREVLEDLASNRRSMVSIGGQDFDSYRAATGFIYQDGDGLLDLPMPKLLGEHQLSNAALAIAALRLARIKVSEEAYAKAMKTVEWPGRFEKLKPGLITNQLSKDADVWIDGGHNPAAGEAISATLLAMDKGQSRKTILICGMINTKEPSGYFAPFTQLDVEVLTVPVSMSEASITPHDLAEISKAAGLKTKACSNLDEAIHTASCMLKENPIARILFCGSLYMVGEVLEKNGTPPT